MKKAHEKNSRKNLRAHTLCMAFLALAFVGCGLLLVETQQPDLLARDFSMRFRYSIVGEEFRVYARVRNAGAAAFTGSGTLRFYQSNDSTIDQSDTEVGTAVLVANLPASANSAVLETTITAPLAPGTYYYGACFDSVAGEASTANNCSSALPRHIVDLSNPDTTDGIAYDLTFGIPRTVRVPTGDGGALFKVEVSEAGTLSAHLPSITDILLQLYDSSNAFLVSDGIGNVFNHRIEYAVAPGTYYITGIDYNGSGLEEFTVQADFIPASSPRPDLTVQDPRIAPIPTNLPGEDLSLTVQVRNTGGAGASASTVNFYRSSDALISSADVLVGTGVVAALTVGETSASIEFETSTPTSLGTYYYGACVTGIENESRITNNCSSAIEVRVTEPSDDHGNGSAQASAMRLGTPVSGVLDRASDQDWFSIQIPSGGGELNVYTTGTSNTTGALYDSDLNRLARRSRGFTITENNFRISHSVDAGTYFIQVSPSTSSLGTYQLQAELADEQFPDLVVQSPTVLTDSATPRQRITLSVQARNAGTAGAGASTVRFYRSSDSVINSADVLVATRAVAALAAGVATANIQIETTTPATSGTYYYGACVDISEGEPNTSNNCSVAVEVQVTERNDLVLQNLSVSPDSLMLGESITLSFQVHNAGPGEAGASTVGIYRSSNPSISMTDTLIGSENTSALAAGETIDFTETVTLDSDALGRYYYGVCVARVTSETSGINNCSPGVAIVLNDDHSNTRTGATVITAGTPQSGRIDGARDQDWFSINIPSGGGELTVYTTGTSNTSGELYRNTAVRLARESSGGSGNNFRISEGVAAGTYLIRVSGSAVGDYELHAEFAPSSDLQLFRPRLSATRILQGEDLSMSVEVRNTGMGNAEASTVRFYRSNDRIINPMNDTEIATVATSPLSGGENGGVISSGNIDTSTLLGVYHFGACIESVDNEIDSSDNCAPVRSVTIVRSDDHGNSRTDASALTLGSPTDGIIEDWGDEDWFSITLSQAGEVNIYTTGSIDTHGMLYDSDGYLLYEDNNDGIEQNFQINIRLAMGEYYIRANEFRDDETGNYTIQADFSATLTDPPVPSVDRAGAPEISLGGSSSASISPVGDYDWYKIETTEAGWLTLYAEGALDTEATLFDASAQLLQENDDGASSSSGPRGTNFLIRQSVNASSTYYLRINEFGNNVAGDYSVRVLFSSSPTTEPAIDQGDTSADATAIALGESTNGSIDPVGDEDWFSITTTGAGTLVVYSLGVTDVEAALFASSDVTNALHEDDDDGPRRNFFIMESLGSAGTYYLSVNGRRNRTGDYSIHTHFIPD